MRLGLLRLQQEPRPEAAQVPVGDARAVVELEHGALVRRRLVPEAAGHPQVDEQHLPALQAHDDVLATPLDRLDALAGEDRRDRSPDPPAGSAARRRSAPRRCACPRCAPRGGRARSRPREAQASGARGRSRASAAAARRRARRRRAPRPPPRRRTPRRVRGSRRARRPRRPRRRAWRGRRRRRSGRSSPPSSAGPAPRWSAAWPIWIAPSLRTNPADGAVTSRTTGARGSASGSGSPPCARIHRSYAASAEPSATASSARLRPSTSSMPRSESASRCATDASTSSGKSGGPLAADRVDRLADLERVARPPARAAGPCR